MSIIELIKKVYKDRHFSYCMYPIEPCTCRKEITMQTNLVSDGYVDSLSLLLLVKAIEVEFKVTIADKDLVTSNFETVEKIQETLIRYLNT